MANEKRLLIEKEPIKKFIEAGLKNPDQKKAFGYDAIQILAEIEFAPTVDAVPVVHGRWIYGEQDEDDNVKAQCSVCGAGDCHSVQLMHKIPYCWKCGAKMDGGNEDAER